MRFRKVTEGYVTRLRYEVSVGYVTIHEVTEGNVRMREFKREVK